ncbi:MAG: rhodanese-like domain-containing protein [Oscillibacter sp.]|jgi:phage shock protein E|nr:rhodanese-like domain-containing protein [Oscillibacter sp.]
MSIFEKTLRPQTGIEAGLLQFEKTEGAVLLDVRSPEEYEGGHLAGSVNLPLNRLAAIDYPKETPLFVYCHSGARSSRACAFLTRQGYRAENLGGLMDYHGPLE